MLRSISMLHRSNPAGALTAKVSARSNPQCHKQMHIKCQKAQKGTRRCQSGLWRDHAPARIPCAEPKAQSAALADGGRRTARPGYRRAIGKV